MYRRFITSAIFRDVFWWHSACRTVRSASPPSTSALSGLWYLKVQIPIKHEWRAFIIDIRPWPSQILQVKERQESIFLFFPKSKSVENKWSHAKEFLKAPGRCPLTVATLPAVSCPWLLCTDTAWGRHRKYGASASVI